MIENILTKGMWADSVNALQSHTATILIGRRKIKQPYVTAQIALSRFEGSGFAKAYIFSCEYESGILTSNVVFLPVEPPISPKDPLRLVKGVSQYSFNNAVSVTFGLKVSNMFAYANCSVFVYQSRNFADILLTPVYFLSESFAGSGLLQDAKPQTSIVFNRKTGEIIHRHDVVITQNAKPLTENDLSSSAIKLAVAMTNISANQLESLSITEDLIPTKRYKVDVKNRRLLSKEITQKK